MPHDATADADRARRFRQEARAASALNHPHIVTVHEVNASEGIDFIVMEYLTGATLEQLIDRKALALRDALKWATQVADALAAAHRAGIVHRDLKPGNVMLTERGDAKVLDFGLAKLAERDGADPSDATTGLEERARTEAGAILGTVAYMSPEQAEGKNVDARRTSFRLDRCCTKRAWMASTKSMILDSGQSNDSALLNQAEAEVRRALQDDPTLLRAHPSLAAVYLIQGHRERMPAELNQALKADPTDKDALLMLMLYHLYGGEYGKAQSIGQEVLERIPVFWPVRLFVAELLRQQGI